MKREEELLLDFLRCYIHDDYTIVIDDVQWSDVCQLAFKQGVGGLVFSEIQRQYNASKLFPLGHDRWFSTLNSQLKLEWYAALQQIEKRNVEVNKVVYKVVKCLKDKNVVSLLLKGQANAQFYSSSLSRTPGDIDLFVGKSKYDEAKQILRDAGFLVGNGEHEDFKHTAFALDNVTIELHCYCELIPHGVRNSYLKSKVDEALQFTDSGFFIDADGCTDRDYLENSLFVKSLPDELNAVYIFIHMFRHFIGGGITLKQVIDYAILVKSLGENGQRIEECLVNTGFKKPWQVFGCILVNHLGFKPEEVPCYDGRYNAKSGKVLKQIFEDGQNRVTGTNGKRQGSGAQTVGQIERSLVLTRGYFRTFSLFPGECIGFFIRLLKNIALKFLD